MRDITCLCTDSRQLELEDCRYCTHLAFITTSYHLPYCSTVAVDMSSQACAACRSAIVMQARRTLSNKNSSSQAITTLATPSVQKSLNTYANVRTTSQTFVIVSGRCKGSQVSRLPTQNAGLVQRRLRCYTTSASSTSSGSKSEPDSPQRIDNQAFAVRVLTLSHFITLLHIRNLIVPSF